MSILRFTLPWLKRQSSKRCEVVYPDYEDVEVREQSIYEPFQPILLLAPEALNPEDRSALFFGPSRSCIK